MNKKLISTGAIFGMIAIILGAFGAHALKKILSIEALSSFETGVKYQMYHALFLILIATVKELSEKAKNTIYNLVVLGVVFFSGSIYLLTTSSLTGIDFKPFGFITPIGGVFLIFAWIILLISLIFKK